MSCLTALSASSFLSKPAIFPSCFFGFCFFSGSAPDVFLSVPSATPVTSMFSASNLPRKSSVKLKSKLILSISNRFFIGASLFACSSPRTSSEDLKICKSTFAMSVFALKIPCIADTIAFLTTIFLKSVTHTPTAAAKMTTAKSGMNLTPAFCALICFASVLNFAASLLDTSAFKLTARTSRPFLSFAEAKCALIKSESA